MKYINTFTLLLIIISFCTVRIQSQDTDALMDELLGDPVNYAIATFKASRIINGHSIEQPAENELDFRISHRFGRISDGAYELWGLDQANIHFSLEYGIVDRLVVGVGRSNYNKTYDGFVKYHILRQSSGAKIFPVHVSYFGSVEYVSLKNDIPDFKNVHRLSYVNQLLIARKFNKRLSLQVTPTYIHKNLVDSTDNKNDILALGLGGRFKITQRLSFNVETFLLETEKTPGGIPYQIPLSIGVDLETGGHVFQIMVTNSLAMREVGFITETTGDWSKGEVHLGFNISRMFDLSRE